MTFHTERSRPAGWHLVLLLVGVLTWCLPESLRAARTDQVFLRNGDRITCDIKELQRGKLRLKTDTMDTVYVDWDDVDRLITDKVMQVERIDGSRVLGSLSEGLEPGDVLVSGTGDPVLLPNDDVVRIVRIKIDEEFFDRLDGSISLGFNYTQSSRVARTHVAGDVRYRREKYEITSSLSVNSTAQSADEDRLRAELQGAYRRKLPDRWFWTVLGSFERNDELGIDLRSLIGGGFGRFVVQSNRINWSFTGGIAGAAEDRRGESGELNFEGLLATDFDLFQFETPKIDVTAGLRLFPSFSDWGRVRTNLDIKLRQELFVKDFFWDLSFYETYDSRPPEGAAAKNDYGIVTSLGYSF